MIALSVIAIGMAAMAQARKGNSTMASQSNAMVRGREGRNIGGAG